MESSDEEVVVVAVVLTNFVMVVLVLRLKVEMENMAELTISDHQEWCFDMKNTSGGDVKEEVIVKRSETIEHQRTTVNLLMKWVKDSKHPATLTFVDIPKNVKNVARKTAHGRVISDQQAGEYIAVLAVECRGLEPTIWHPAAKFRGQSSGGTRFKDIDLSEREWFDYDQEHDECVSLTGLDYRFEVA